MYTGNLQRRWSEVRPQEYDKATRIVCMDIKEEQGHDEGGNPVAGFSFLQVELDRLPDYGHVKSQLIEAGFAQKDEFGLLMNAMEAMTGAANEASSWKDFKDTVAADEAVAKFRDFCAFRSMCAEAAKTVMSNY